MEHNKNNHISFMALVVHKLKNPVSSIKLSLEMLLDGDFGDLNVEQRKVIERTYQKNNNLIILINDLFNVSKINSKNFNTVKLKDVNLGSLIESIVDCKKEEITKKGIEIKIEKPESKISKVKLDKEKVFLVVQNIFDNAVRYSKIGGEVIVSFSIKEHSLEIKVKDQGIGISDEDKDNIFTEFFRGENAQNIDPTGSGLGLYISKSIVDQLNGKIWFESTENKGSTFFVELPLE